MNIIISLINCRVHFLEESAKLTGTHLKATILLIDKYYINTCESICCQLKLILVANVVHQSSSSSPVSSTTVVLYLCVCMRMFSWPKKLNFRPNAVISRRGR